MPGRPGLTGRWPQACSLLDMYVPIFYVNGNDVFLSAARVKAGRICLWHPCLCPQVALLGWGATLFVVKPVFRPSDAARSVKEAVTPEM